ncbi:MAG: NADH-quinone oxidoreductase subunit J [Sandaracinaceae bacterium]|nr:NADH-quinone oxidoreductase subunit J [Sandaracinaceae bacterium]
MSGGGELVFLLCGLVAMVTAVLTVSAKNPLRAALSLLAHVVSLAGLYLTLHAHLLAAIQMLVYAGAVVVLFIFVIMLIGPSGMKPSDNPRGRVLRGAAALVMAMVGASIAFAVAATQAPYVDLDQCRDGSAECGQFGGVDALGDAIFSGAAVPFELVSVLLLVAIIAAVAVARGHSPEEKKALEGRGKAVE